MPGRALIVVLVPPKLWSVVDRKTDRRRKLGVVLDNEYARLRDGQDGFDDGKIVAVDVDCQYVRIIGTKECSDLSNNVDDILDVDECLSDP